MDGNYSIVRRLNETRLLAVNGENHYVISYASSERTFGDEEVLVFPATPEGEITSWLEVDGRRGYNLERFVQEFCFEKLDLFFMVN